MRLDASTGEGAAEDARDDVTLSAREEPAEEWPLLLASLDTVSDPDPDADADAAGSVSDEVRRFDTRENV